MTAPSAMTARPTKLNRLLRIAGVFSITALLSTVALLSGFANADGNTPIADSPLVISEIQTGGCVTEGQLGCTGDAKDAKKEFIELFNQRSTELDARGWQVQYFTNSGSPIVLATLNGVIAGHSSVLLVYDGYLTETAQISFTSTSSFGALAESSGHIQLVDADSKLLDRVGWGSANQPLVKAAKAPTAGRSLQRLSLSDTALSNTGSNYVDFLISDTPTPHSGGYTADPPIEATPSPSPTPTPDPTTNPISTPTAAVSCEGVIISEILPNPAGADAGHEFIELHNPTNEVISLAGCSLQTGSSSKSTYALTNVSLQPDEYRSFSDTETSLTLANAAGGTVWLLTTTDELQAVTYGANLADDVSWAFVDGTWAQTYTPTPGAANTLTASEPCPAGQERNLDTNRCQTIDSTASSAADTPGTLTPCKVGQERNPDTNRCRNVASTSTDLTPCKAGQTRNPATNRCAASTTASSSTATACKAGQERNPETNRCKAVAAATTAAKAACPVGQERNPDTGRCRKSTTASGITKVQDVKTPLTASHGRLLLIVVAVLVAVGYAIFEWRQEIGQKLNQLFGKRSNQLGQART